MNTVSHTFLNVPDFHLDKTIEKIMPEVKLAAKRLVIDDAKLNI
jgi:hypothetical protein